MNERPPFLALLVAAILAALFFSFNPCAPLQLWNPEADPATSDILAVGDSTSIPLAQHLDAYVFSKSGGDMETIKNFLNAWKPRSRFNEIWVMGGIADIYNNRRTPAQESDLIRSFVPICERFHPNKIILIDPMKIRQMPMHLLRDGVHPNDAGYRYILDHVEDFTLAP